MKINCHYFEYEDKNEKKSYFINALHIVALIDKSVQRPRENENCSFCK